MILEKIWIYVALTLCYFTFWLEILVILNFHDNPFYVLFGMGWIIIVCILCKFVHGYNYIRPDRSIISTMFIIIFFSAVPHIYTSATISSKFDASTNTSTSTTNMATLNESNSNNDKYNHETLTHSVDNLVVGSLSNTHIHVHVNSLSITDTFEKLFPFVVSFQNTPITVMSIVQIFFTITSTLLILWKHTTLCKKKSCQHTKQHKIRDDKHRNVRDKTHVSDSKDDSKKYIYRSLLFYHKRDTWESKIHHSESLESLFLKPVFKSSKYKKRTCIDTYIEGIANLCKFTQHINIISWDNTYNNISTQEINKTSIIDMVDDNETLSDSKIKKIFDQLEKVLCTNVYVLCTEIMNIWNYQKASSDSTYQQNSTQYNTMYTLKDIIKAMSASNDRDMINTSDLGILALFVITEAKKNSVFSNNTAYTTLHSKKTVLSNYESFNSENNRNEDTSKKNRNITKDYSSSVGSQLKTVKRDVKEYSKGLYFYDFIEWIYIILYITSISLLFLYYSTSTCVIPPDLSYEFVWQSVIIRLHITYFLWLVLTLLFVISQHRLCTEIIFILNHLKYKVLFFNLLNKFLRVYEITHTNKRFSRQFIKRGKVAEVVQVYSIHLVYITTSLFKKIFQQDANQFNDGSLDCVIQTSIKTFLLSLPILLAPLFLTSLYLVFTIFGVIVILFLIVCTYEGIKLYTYLDTKKVMHILGLQEDVIQNSLSSLIMQILCKSDTKQKKRSKKNAKEEFSEESSAESNSDDD